MTVWHWYKGRAGWEQAALALAAAAALFGAVVGLWALMVALTSRALPA
jgi:ABC-type polysaccharide transport system permease subunit